MGAEGRRWKRGKAEIPAVAVRHDTTRRRAARNDIKFGFVFGYEADADAVARQKRREGVGDDAENRPKNKKQKNSFRYKHCRTFVAGPGRAAPYFKKRFRTGSANLQTSGGGRGGGAGRRLGEGISGELVAARRISRTGNFCSLGQNAAKITDLRETDICAR